MAVCGPVTTVYTAGCNGHTTLYTAVYTAVYTTRYTAVYTARTRPHKGRL